MSTPNPPSSETVVPAVQLNDLSYKFTTGQPGVRNISFALPPRSRTLLIGANGAGKTTLLRLVAGKRLGPRGAILVHGNDPFAVGLEGVTYLGTEWVLNPVVRTDVGVRELLASVGGNAYPDRRDELVRVLDVDLDWRMHAVSDGERRRVQLAMGLLRPWNVLLLDEVTVDLDVLSRCLFLEWLKKETTERDATVVYATHILDGIAGWPSHLVHMHLGTVKEWGVADKFLDQVRKREMSDDEEWGNANNDLSVGRSRTGNSLLGELVLGWLRHDLGERGPRSQDRAKPGVAPDADAGWGGYGDETGKKFNGDVPGTHVDKQQDS